jgi:hypothetical protein
LVLILQGENGEDEGGEERFLEKNLLSPPFYIKIYGN